MFGFIGVTVIVAVLFLANISFAANPFNMGKVMYFSNGKKSMKKTQKGMDWREASLNADGTITYISPPPAVARLLDDPTPQNARLYLNWQKKKIDRIVKAQEALLRVQKDGRQ